MLYVIKSLHPQHVKSMIEQLKSGHCKSMSDKPLVSETVPAMAQEKKKKPIPLGNSKYQLRFSSLMIF